MTGPRPRSRRAPGPGPLSAVRGPIAFLRDPLAYFLGLQQRWDRIVRTRGGPFLFHTLLDPALVREALVDRHECYTKRGVIDELLPLLGDGLLASEGTRWRGRRAGVAPLIGRRALPAFAEVMESEARRVVEAWRGARAESRPVDATGAAMTFAIAVIGRVLFGFEIHERAAATSEAVETVARLALRRSSALVKLPSSAPTPLNRAYRGAISFLEDLVQEAIDRDVDDTDSLLPRLREIVDEPSGSRLTRRDLRDEAMTLLLAGHETTASTLAWTLDRLARDADLQQRVRAETRHAAGLLGLEPLPLLDAVVSEALRLAPPAWLIMRRVLRAHEVGGFEIPPGSFVSVPVYAIHRNPALWPRPHDFVPERFLGAGEAPPAAFMPFGIGPRRCPGEAFARMETRVLLTRILGAFELEPASPPPVPLPLATLRTAERVRLRLL